jgi:hypothetical protein
MATAAVALAAHRHRLMTTNLIFRHFCVDKRTNKMFPLSMLKILSYFNCCGGLGRDRVRPADGAIQAESE